MTVQREEKLPHILVIDDEEGILMTLRLYLQDDGYRVSTVENTEAARQLLATDEPDVILGDVMMPGEDGLSFLAYVHQCLPDMPVIIMTGCAQLQTAINAVKHGAFDFIQKPFDFDYLNQLIAKALEHSTLRQMERRYRAELEETVALRTDELKTAMTQLETTSALLLKAASEKNEFMTTITHEMRTPMNGVIGALDLLADSNIVGSQKEFVLLARQAADNMVVLINQLLSFSAFSGNSPAVCHEAMHLPDLFETLKRKHLPCFFKKWIVFKLQASPEAHLSKRHKMVAFSNTIFIAGSRLMTRKNSGIRDLPDLAGKNVVTFAASTSEKMLRKMNSENNSRINIMLAFDRSTKPLAILQAGQADAFMMDDILLYATIRDTWRPDEWTVTGTPQSFEAYACVMRKDDPLFKKVVDQEIARIMKSGEAEAVYRKWLMSPIPPKGVNLGFPMSEAMIRLFKNPNDKPFE